MVHARRPAGLVLALVGALAASLVAIAPVSAAVTPTPTPAPTPCPTPVAQPYQHYAPATTVPTQGAYFSYLKRSKADQMAIRNRVLQAINATNGLTYTPVYSDYPGGCTKPDGTTPNSGEKYVSSWAAHRGTINLATWSFNDSGVYQALRRAVARGTQVRIVAAQGVNAENNYKPWRDTRNMLNGSWARGLNRYNAAWECRGACRGSGGTPHSKYFLFTGLRGRSTPITIQTSMNLTAFAYNGQWNQAVVSWDQAVYNRFNQIFTQSIRRERHGFESGSYGGHRLSFYPRGALSTRYDPALAALSQVHCTGATVSGGRTKVRVQQYALYDTRGVALAKKMRALWNAGCNVSIIYGVTSKPVLKILRYGGGRGPVPMKQSVIKNSKGEIVKYNHSKWLAIAGYYGSNRATYTVLSGSSNWSNFAYGCDEQMMQSFGYAWAAPFFRTFDITWRQKTSKKPSAGGSLSGARVAARGSQSSTFGYGKFRFMEND